MPHDELRRKIGCKLKQVGKDLVLLRDGAADGTQVKAVVWYGTEKLPTSGEANKLRRALIGAHIPYRVVPLPKNLRCLRPPVWITPRRFGNC
jgi:hypothetical protein